MTLFRRLSVDFDIDSTVSKNYSSDNLTLIVDSYFNKRLIDSSHQP